MAPEFIPFFAVIALTLAVLVSLGAFAVSISLALLWKQRIRVFQVTSAISGVALLTSGTAFFFGTRRL